jgi:enoyl-CoA hydratase/carnithine racemase
MKPPPVSSDLSNAEPAASRGLLIEELGQVVRLTLSREHRLNALNMDLFEALLEALRDCEHRKVAAIVLTGSGTRAFSAGADLKETAAQTDPAFVRAGHAVVLALEEHPAPVIAAIEGYCLGGGLELALGCDIRVASEEAIFGLPELSVNYMPGWGGTFRLPRLVGVSRAKEVILLDRRFSGAEGLAWGLVAETVAAGTTADRAVELAQHFVSLDRETVARVKRLVLETWGQPTATAVQIERHVHDYVATRPSFHATAQANAPRSES